jgi:tetratricopeptide (TPR) repeat protein
MRRLVVLVLVAVVVAQTGNPVRAQAASQSAAASWLARLSSYLEAVNEHKLGRVDMAARLVGFSTETDLDEVRADFLNLVAICKRELGRSVRSPSIVYRDTLIPFADVRKVLGLTDDEAASGNANRILLRAAVLHADIGMLVAPFLPRGIGCTARGSVLVQDGNSIGMGCICIHWIMGRGLLDAIRPDPGRNDVVRLWYHATITYLLETGNYADADAHIAHAQLLFPDEPAILFEHGYYHEGYASPTVQSAALESGADRRGAKIHLEEALNRYRRALEVNPRFVEARVHRGKVLLDLSHPGEAVQQLRQAVAEAQGPKLRYYAHLLLGRAEEASGNVAGASEQFLRASEIYPQAQSPHLSLTLLARERGDRTGAREALQKVLALPHTDRGDADPWWDYYRWQNQGAGDLFAELYASLPDRGRQ